MNRFNWSEIGFLIVETSLWCGLLAIITGLGIYASPWFFLGLILVIGFGFILLEEWKTLHL